MLKVKVKIQIVIYDLKVFFPNKIKIHILYSNISTANLIYIFSLIYIISQRHL